MPPCREFEWMLCALCFAALSACATNQNGASQHPPGAELAGETETEDASAEYRRGNTPLAGQETVRAIEYAITHYQDVIQRGGWPIIAPGPAFQPDSQDRRTMILAARLRASGDIPNSLPDGHSSGNISQGLGQFQLRHGLRATGVADAHTLEALNVPAEVRLAQLRSNLVRIRELAAQAQKPGRYVLVNIPAFQLEAVEGGRVVRRHRVVVGKPSRPTPSVIASIRAINLMPDWHVPESIVDIDLIPRLQTDPDYLRREHIRVLADWQGPEIDLARVDWRSPVVHTYKFKQDPGTWNALGVLRIDMKNEFSVYLHDTPMKSLFNQRQRDFSAGCVRVEGVFDLANWLIRETPETQALKVDPYLANGTAAELALKTPVPVYFTYITAWASPDGRVDFRDDIYARDSGQTVVAGPVPQAPAQALAP
jgi:murein L,D-transpeptidase YcbB/YkuD